MKTLLFKEIRENVRLAALGLVIHALLLAVQYRSYTAARPSLFSPLASQDLFWSTLWFGGIFAAVLGWLQIHNERRPDLWAFLLHRPMTRTQMFLAKTGAGMALYTVVVGLPLAWFVAWARWPGHVAAPFDIVLLRPIAAAALAGTVAYFAGMLTGLRQARWYASRALSLGIALAACTLMLVAHYWWLGFLVILIGTLVVATASWGAFKTHGYCHGQPAVAHACLIISTTVGWGLIAIVAALLLSNLFPQRNRGARWTHYAMTGEGVICKITEGGEEKAHIQDLEGKPILDPKTLKEVELADFNARTRRLSSVTLGDEPRRRPQEWVFTDMKAVPGWGKTEDTLWYCWERYGRLVAYDAATRRCVGSLGPGGFARDIAGDGSRFNTSVDNGGWNLASTDTILYRLNLGQRALKPLFTTTADDPLRSSQEIRFERDGAEERYVAVVTRHSVHLLKPGGELVWKVPYDAQNPAYRRAEIHFLSAPGQYALWMSPSAYEDERSDGRLPIHVVWVDHQQGVIKNVDLPALPRPEPASGAEEFLSCAVAPPIILYLLPKLVPGFNPKGLPLELLLPSWAMALLVCLPLALWVARRYRLPLAAQAGWVVFLALFGLPALLAFLSVHEWPARIPCPACKRSRLVNRPQCEHCGAAFAAPEPTGTEIFAPLAQKQEISRVEPAAAGGVVG